jgi:hypothetical protein
MFGSEPYGVFVRPFANVLSDKYLAEGIGTYTTTAPVDYNSKWTKKGGSGSNTTRSNVGGGKSFNSADALKAYLDKQPANSPDKPIKVAMKVNDMMIKDIVKAIWDAGKYVSLDLSGSPLTKIPERAFQNCKTLAGIIIPNGVTSIGGKAFEDCINLASVTISNSVTSIEEWAFIDCTGLTSVTIGNSVTSIGSYTFSGCTNLTSITIPNSVTSIRQGAFNCTSLTNVTFQGTIPASNISSGGYSSFYGDLREKYLAGGIGTYTTTSPVGKNSKWTKQ